MASIRRVGVGGWLDPLSAPALAARLGSNLIERFQGKRPRFLTLTYNRTPYAGPRELWDAASADRHIRRFIDALENLIGFTLKGKWICKAEFQAGGWLHWHLLIDHDSPIEWRLLEKAWFHGRVNIKMAHGASLRYFAKYLAKADEYPQWLLLHPTRSVKIIRTSPGFWGADFRKPRNPSEPIEHATRVPSYVSIGQRVFGSGGRVLLRDDRSGRVLTFKADFYRVLAMALARYGRPVAIKGKWHTFTADFGYMRRQLEGEARRAAAGLLSLYQSSKPPEWLIAFWQSEGWVSGGKECAA